MAPASRTSRPESLGGLASSYAAPTGAVIKPAAATPELLQHRGRALVFDSLEDLHARIDDPDLDVDETVELLGRRTTTRNDFEAPDIERFPALRLAREAAESGGTAAAALNAANEIAVAAFLAGRLGFTAIPELIERVLERHVNAAATTLEAVLGADHWARDTAGSLLAGLARAEA